MSRKKKKNIGIGLKESWLSWLENNGACSNAPLPPYAPEMSMLEQSSQGKGSLDTEEIELVVVVELVGQKSNETVEV